MTREQAQRVALKLLTRKTTFDLVAKLKGVDFWMVERALDDLCTSAAELAGKSFMYASDMPDRADENARDTVRAVRKALGYTHP